MMTLRETFTGLLSTALAHGSHHKRMRGHNRGTIVGEGSDPGQTIFSGTRRRRTGHHKNEGKDQADGPHLTVSGLSLSAFDAVFVGRVNNHEAFPEFCAKSPKWFRHAENCFVVGSSDETIETDANDFSDLWERFKDQGWPRAMAIRGGNGRT
jgi:hypothetical protein